MAPSTIAQKTALAEFQKVTGGMATEKDAKKYLQKYGWKLNESVNAYFHGGGASTDGLGELNLRNQFASLRNDAQDDKDKIGAEGAMNYFKSLGVNFEDASLFVALFHVRAEGMGEIKKTGFVEGWKAAGVDATLTAQRSLIKRQVLALRHDGNVFRQIYRYAFIAGKDADQRAITLDSAIVFWEMLFRPPGRPWVGKQTGRDWLHYWVVFLREKWTHSVNKDMWNQTLAFADQSMEDESLSFYQEDGPWPGVIDEFVAWWRNKENEMDIDA